MATNGLLNIGESESDAKIIAAAIALFGTILGAVVTTIGTILKYSIDQRNSQLTAIESARRMEVARDAADRNRVELAIGAISLLAENNSDTTKKQMSGALLALVSLEQHELAVTLLDVLRDAGDVEMNVVNHVVRGCLMDGDERVQTAAANILFRNADYIQSSEHLYYWPVDRKWNGDYPVRVRQAILQAAGKWMNASVRNRFPPYPPLEILYLALDDALKHDQEEREDEEREIAGVAAAFMRPVVERLEQSRVGWIPVGAGKVDLTRVSEQVANGPSIDRSTALRIAKEIEHSCEHVERIEQLQTYLSAFGYIRSSVHDAFGYTAVDMEVPPHRFGVFDDRTKAALEKLQAFFGLPPSGELDDATLGVLAQPRCGCPDLGDAKHSETRWNKRALTYTSVEYTSDLTVTATDDAIARALDMWAEVTTLEFSQVSGYSDADIRVRFVSGDHGDGVSFDGPFEAIGHVFRPIIGGDIAGDIHLNDACTWTLDQAGGCDLQSVAAHMIGHALGLGHSSNPDALMFPSLARIMRSSRSNLHTDDIAAIEALYGERSIK